MLFKFVVFMICEKLNSPILKWILKIRQVRSATLSALLMLLLVFSELSFTSVIKLSLCLVKIILIVLAY